METNNASGFLPIRVSLFKKTYVVMRNILKNFLLDGAPKNK